MSSQNEKPDFSPILPYLIPTTQELLPTIMSYGKQKKGRYRFTENIKISILNQLKSVNMMNSSIKYYQNIPKH